MQLFALINSRSGGGKGSKVLETLRNRNHEGVTVVAAREISPESLREAKEKDGTYSHLLLGGGDGTVSWAAGALGELKAPAMFLGLGTANDLRRELRSPTLRSEPDPFKFCERLAAQKEHQLQLYKVEDAESKHLFGTFINYFSLGFDGAVVEAFKKLRETPFAKRFASPTLNRLLFVVAGLSNFAYRLPPELKVQRVSGDGAVDEGELQSKSDYYLSKGMRGIFFPNIRCALGLGLSNTESNAFDRTLEMIRINSVGTYARMITAAMFEKFAPRPAGRSGGWLISNLPESGVKAQIDGEAVLIEKAKSIRISPSHTFRILGNPRSTE